MQGIWDYNQNVSQFLQVQRQVTLIRAGDHNGAKRAKTGSVMSSTANHKHNPARVGATGLLEQKPLQDLLSFIFGNSLCCLVKRSQLNVY